MKSCWRKLLILKRISYRLGEPSFFLLYPCKFFYSCGDMNVSALTLFGSLMKMRISHQSQMTA